MKIDSEKAAVTVSSTGVDFSKRYLKYLTKKYLQKEKLREFLRVVAQGKAGYKVRGCAGRASLAQGRVWRGLASTERVRARAPVPAAQVLQAAGGQRGGQVSTGRLELRAHTRARTET